MTTPRRDWCGNFRYLTNGVENTHTNPDVFTSAIEK